MGMEKVRGEGHGSVLASLLEDFNGDGEPATPDVEDIAKNVTITAFIGE